VPEDLSKIAFYLVISELKYTFMHYDEFVKYHGMFHQNLAN